MPPQDTPPAASNRTPSSLTIVCALISLAASCALWSAHKMAWNDEALSWTLLTDPSLPHMLRAGFHGADGGMPLYYITAWLWRLMFGSSDLALRLYSSACVCAALFITWSTLRRSFTAWPTAVGVLVTWCTSDLLLNQNAEIRYYGLYLLTVSLAAAIYARLAEQSQPRAKLLVAALLARAALALTHVLGISYGVLIVLALMFSDHLHGWAPRWKVYFAQAAGWLADPRLAAGRPCLDGKRQTLGLDSAPGAGRPDTRLRVRDSPAMDDSLRSPGTTRERSGPARILPLRAVRVGYVESLSRIQPRGFPLRCHRREANLPSGAGVVSAVGAASSLPPVPSNNAGSGPTLHLAQRHRRSDHTQSLRRGTQLPPTALRPPDPTPANFFVSRDTPVLGPPTPAHLR